MKNLVCLPVALLAFVLVYAQPKNEENNRQLAFGKAVETILGDFPYNYKHISGNLLIAQGEWEHYASTITLPGAKNCVVGRYHSVLDTTADWQALMFNSEEYEAAAREHKRLFHQLNTCKMKTVDGSVFYLDGKLEQPDVVLDFVTSTFRVQTSDERYRLFKIELELLYQMNEWVININMVSKKKDSDMRPDWMVDNQP